jgi:hypothetical protein
MLNATATMANALHEKSSDGNCLKVGVRHVAKQKRAPEQFLHKRHDQHQPVKPRCQKEARTTGERIALNGSKPMRVLRCG